MLSSRHYLMYLILFTPKCKILYLCIAQRLTEVRRTKQPLFAHLLTSKGDSEALVNVLVTINPNSILGEKPDRFLKYGCISLNFASQSII